MGLNQLRSMLAPAVASLFLIRWLCSFAAREPAAGIPFQLYPLHPEGKVSYECNARSIVLYLTRDGRIRINETEIAPADLTLKLDKIFEYRVERRAYVVADSAVPYGRFVDYLSRIASVQPKLDFVLLSGDLQREAEREQTFSGLCGLIHPLQ